MLYFYCDALYRDALCRDARWFVLSTSSIIECVTLDMIYILTKYLFIKEPMTVRIPNLSKRAKPKKPSSSHFENWFFSSQSDFSLFFLAKQMMSHKNPLWPIIIFRVIDNQTDDFSNYFSHQNRLFGFCYDFGQLEK